MGNRTNVQILWPTDEATMQASTEWMCFAKKWAASLCMCLCTDQNIATSQSSFREPQTHPSNAETRQRVDTGLCEQQKQQQQYKSVGFYKVFGLVAFRLSANAIDFCVVCIGSDCRWIFGTCHGSRQCKPECISKCTLTFVTAHVCVCEMWPPILNTRHCTTKIAINPLRRCRQVKIDKATFHSPSVSLSLLRNSTAHKLHWISEWLRWSTAQELFYYPVGNK